MVRSSDRRLLMTPSPDCAHLLEIRPVTRPGSGSHSPAEGRRPAPEGRSWRRGAAPDRAARPGWRRARGRRRPPGSARRRSPPPARSPERHGVVPVGLARDVRASHQGARVERATGIEPAFSAWEADVLPLNYARRWPSHYPLARHGSVRPHRPGGAGGGADRDRPPRRRLRPAVLRGSARRPVRPPATGPSPGHGRATTVHPGTGPGAGRHVNT